MGGARKAGVTIFYAFGDHSPDGRDYPDRLTDTDMDNLIAYIHSLK